MSLLTKRVLDAEGDTYPIAHKTPEHNNMSELIMPFKKIKLTHISDNNYMQLLYKLRQYYPVIWNQIKGARDIPHPLSIRAFLEKHNQIINQGFNSYCKNLLQLMTLQKI